VAKYKQKSEETNYFYQRPIDGFLHLIYVKHKKAGRKDVRPVDKSAGYGRTDR
jgi:hypothetical protein